MSIQDDLFGYKDTPDFDGKTYERKYDHSRLATELDDVFNLMKDGEWRTLSEISEVTGRPEASISARLRDFRKDKFGGHTVNRRIKGNRLKGLWEYQLIRKEETYVY